MKTKTTITELSHEDLVNLLSTATYGSSWLSCTVAKATSDSLDIKEEDCREDVWAKALLAGFPVFLTDHQAEGCTYGPRGTVNEDDEESAVDRTSSLACNPPWMATSHPTTRTRSSWPPAASCTFATRRSTSTTPTPRSLPRSSCSDP